MDFRNSSGLLKMNAETSRYRKPHSIKWKFINEDNIGYSKKSLELLIKKSRRKEENAKA